MFPVEFSQQLLKKAQVPSEEWSAFVGLFQEMKCAKGEILLSPGDEAKSVFLVQEGIIRNYFNDEKGKELTKVFRTRGGLIGPYAEILVGEKSRYYIQATTKAVVWKFAYSDFEKMMREGDRSWERLGRKMAENNYLEKERREWELMHLSAEVRYHHFLDNFGELASQIPQYQVASYLGISPEALNRQLSPNRKS
ncbi:MAG: Crp/Fnr family transcriptional regulator [Bacteriovoracaceae bacterium]|nr:Crp/Fnr family transcriptional regulator [Bacteriovoracaceae bacterium]